jgi:signal transduction histidine kinase
LNVQKNSGTSESRKDDTLSSPGSSVPTETRWPRRIFTSGYDTPAVWPLVVYLFSGLVGTASAITLAGWFGHRTELTMPMIGPMRWSAAVCFIALSLVVLLRHLRRSGQLLTRVGDILCLVPLAFAVMSILALLFQSTPGIPHAIFVKLAGLAAQYGLLHVETPWRMSMGSSVGIGFLAFSLLMLDRLRRLSTALQSIGLMLALSTISGFLFRAHALFNARLLDAMSLQSALSLLLLFAAAFACRPTREPMRSLFAQELGIEARIELLVGTWALPLLIGLSVSDGIRRGWYEPSFALSLFAVAVIGLQTVLIWRSDLALTQLTRNKQRMEEVLRKNEKLAVAGRLAASISHEINNPLESISNLLYLIRTSESMDEQHTYADLATEELRRVTQITTQTLSFYRENTAPVLSDITPILASSVQLLRGKISSMGVDVIEEYYPPLPAIVCSAGELRQVLVNLISNALDATPRGGRIVVRAALSKAWTRAGRSVIRIAVSDTGCGMPPNVLARVFEPFFTTKEKTGNGLGLWVAADLIEKHGGWMKVKSCTNDRHHGTTFQLVLPVGSTD